VVSHQKLNELRNRKVLVTGGTGFIGRHLVRRLLGCGADITLLARPAHAQDLAAELSGKICVLPGALDDPATLGPVVAEANPQIIIHLGGYSDPARDLSRSEQAMTVNLMATMALAQAAMDAGVEAFVTTGTSEEYGHQAVPFHEDLPMKPLSPYSASKAAVTLWLGMLHDTHGFPAVMIRPFLCYGPGQTPPKLVPSAILAALAGQDFPMTSGQQTRELTYVDDLVDGLLTAALNPAARGRVLNLGSGQEHTALDIVERIFALSGSSGRPRPGTVTERASEMNRVLAETERAAKVLGWQATTQLETGLRETIGWARRHGDCPVPLIPEDF